MAIISKTLFFALSLLGTSAIWGRSVLDGSLALILGAVDSATYVLPGAKDELLPSITGIKYPFDHLLRVLILFFWEAVDGSHPACSTIGVYFLGQYAPILTMLFMDSFRSGQVSGFAKAIAWAMCFQSTGIGATSGIWAANYLSSSPLLQSRPSLPALQRASLASPLSTALLIPSMALFAALSVTMALPSPNLVSNRFQQIAIAAWNVFPLPIFALHTTLSSLLPTPKTTRQSHLKAVRITNAVVLLASSAVHISIVSLTLATVLFPVLFAPGYAEALSPGSIFVPPVAITTSTTPGDGTAAFLMWDQVFGYTVVMLVALSQLKTAVKASGREWSWGKAGVAAAMGSVVAGPGSVCLAASWIRDEVLFCGEGKKEK